MANDGPQLEDPGIIAQRMMGSRTGGGGGDGDKNQFETIADGLAVQLSRLLGKVGLGIRLRTLGSTSMFAQFTPPQSLIEKPINQGGAALGPKGGVLAGFVSKEFKLDFSKLTKPEIQLPVIDVPNSFLGTLSSQDFGGGGGREMSREA